MVAIKANMFGGMIPAVDDHLLPPNSSVYSARIESNGAHAENTWLYSGALIGIPEWSDIHTLVDPLAAFAYRIPSSYGEGSYIFDSLWLEFQNADTNVLHSPVFNDSFDRYYWVSSSVSPRYNTRERIELGQDPYLLGINPPGDITVGAAGGAAANLPRAYVITWVTEFGEESAPSDAYLITDHPDATYTVTFPAVDPDDVGGPNRIITTVRVYRTVTSADGVATYFFVGEVPIATATFVDTLTDAEIALNEQLQSLNYLPPPADLSGWVSMANGMIAGWRSNEVWFCEPYRPHAWPPAYVLTVDYPIVGLGVIGQTLVVCTLGNPVSISGIHPSVMSQGKYPLFAPCTSRGSIISTPAGVYYSSPEGLVLATPNGAAIATSDLITKDKWQLAARLGSLHAASLGHGYYAFGAAQQGVVQIDAFQITGPQAFATEDTTGAMNGIFIDDRPIGFNVLTSETDIVNVYNDAWSSEVFVITDGKVKFVDFNSGDFKDFTWKSKIYETQDLQGLAAAYTYFTVPDSVDPTDNFGTMNLYSDYGLVFSRRLRTSGELMRLPSDMKSIFWQFEYVNCKVRISSMKMGSSITELTKV